MIVRAISLVAPILALITAFPSAGQAQALGPEWRVADRFRLFEEATDKRGEVSDLLDRMASSQGNLEDYYDDFLRLLSDKETGYVTSAALRRSHYSSLPGVDGPGRYDSSYLYPKTYTLEVRDRTHAGARCSYQSTIEQQEGPCSEWTRVQVAGGIGSEPFAGASGSISVSTDAHAPIQLNFIFKDKLIVALGDSFISGEGNPDVPSLLKADPANEIFEQPSWGDKVSRGSELVREAEWWDTPCHRSLLSWPVLSSLAYAARHPKEAVSLVHLGCSGAVVDDLVERGENGLPGGGNENQSQIAQLTTLLRGAPEGATVRTPDRVLLSIGGNDIGFVGVLTTLTLPPNGYTVGPLATRIIGKEAGAVCPYKSTGRPLSRLCSSLRSAEDRLQDLHPSYHRLAAALSELGVDAERVYHAQYPNPLICGGGRPCDNSAKNGWNTPGADRHPNGFEALMGIFPRKGRGPWFKSWNFEIQYYPEKEFESPELQVGQLLYPEFPDVKCDNVPEMSDSEVCQALLVHYRLNREVRGSGFRTISGHLETIVGHGLMETGGLDLSLPISANGQWITSKDPNTFDPYERLEDGRWFRIPNDSILTQFHFHGNEPRFHQGTVHPTYRAHLAYAQAALESALRFTD